MKNTIKLCLSSTMLLMVFANGNAQQKVVSEKVILKNTAKLPLPQAAISIKRNLE